MNVSATGSSVQALDLHHHGFANRIGNLQKRVELGVARGTIDRDEAAAFEKSLADIAQTIHEERQANGGALTPEQRQQVAGDLNDLSRQIFTTKHGAGGPPEVE